MLRPRKRPAGAGPDGKDELRAQPVVDEIHPARGLATGNGSFYSIAKQITRL
jgi:hypothetical protein